MKMSNADIVLNAAERMVKCKLAYIMRFWSWPLILHNILSVHLLVVFQNMAFYFDVVR